MDDHSGHRDRMRDKFINQKNLDNFTEHEIIEMLLFYSVHMKNTNNIAHALIDRYGSIAGVLDVDVEELMKNDGISKKSAVLLSMLKDVFKRYSDEKWKAKKDKVSSSKSAGEYMISKFMNKKYEVFCIACLDSQNRINRLEVINQGSINEAHVYSRLVVEAALRYNANSVIMAHNHPGGTLKPSDADINLTRKLKNALELVDIKTLDHIIVADGKYLSLADEGYI
jgi:DNA repair protein RadC